MNYAHEKEHLFNVCVRMLGTTSCSDFYGVDIVVPPAFFWLHESGESGYEDKLEGQEVEIRAKFRSEMPENTGFLKLKISWERPSNLDAVTQRIDEAPTEHIPPAEKMIVLPLREARHIVSELLSARCGAYVVNLTTR